MHLTDWRLSNSFESFEVVVGVREEAGEREGGDEVVGDELGRIGGDGDVEVAVTSRSENIHIVRTVETIITVKMVNRSKYFKFVRKLKMSISPKLEGLGRFWLQIWTVEKAINMGNI